MAAKRWNITRWIFLLSGLLGLILAFMPGLETAVPGPLLALGIAALSLAVALFSSDELLLRIRLIIWDRKWPR
jgi:hypothetical protein